MKIVRCAHCGNIAVLLNDSGVPMMCCGEEMQMLEAGTTDAALEKHVPEVNVTDGMMDVSVGKVHHPMAAEHFIQWILLEQGGKVQVQWLKPEDAPRAAFKAEEGAYAVYEYCNLHGLWKTEGTV